MTLLQVLQAVAAVYSAHTGIPLTRISGRIFGHRHAFERLAAGRDVETATLEKAMHYFSRNWPADLPWPAGVRRRWPLPPPQSAENPIRSAIIATDYHARPDKTTVRTDTSRGTAQTA